MRRRTESLKWESYGGTPIIVRDKETIEFLNNEIERERKFYEGLLQTVIKDAELDICR